MTTESHDNQMNNSRISANLRKNHIHVILSPIYPHFASNIDVKFTRLVIAIQPNFMKFLDFYPTFWSIFIFNNFSLTFLVKFQFPCLFPVFQVALQPWSMDLFIAMEHWAYYGSNSETQSISEILRHRKSHSLI